MKKIAEYLTPIIVILCILVIIMMNRSFLGYRILEVATGSMEPNINIGDIVIVKKSDNYEVQDIVTYETEGAFVTHRIVTKNGEDVVTKGDANNIVDTKITVADIAGKVIKVIPKAIVLIIKIGILLIMSVLIYLIFRKEDKRGR